MFKYVVEICTESGSSTTDKGQLLENLTATFLATQGFQVTESVRVTGMEIDVIACDKTTGERIYVECKAHRSNISADVITKLLGNVILRDVASGWLIVTHDFGKDAKGIYDEWDQKPTDQRRRLRMYPPEKFVDRLCQALILISAEKLHTKPDLYGIGGEAYLLITARGNYWGIPLIDVASGATAAVAVHDGKTGSQIYDGPLLSWLSQLDSSLSDLIWTLPESSSDLLDHPSSSAVQQELDHIVSVPVAEHWADYRPSRPSDYVGRETIQREIFSFLDRVREGQSRTRMLALKAPSGWGKSSSVLKIADRAGNKLNRAKYHVYTVDSRAALTSRFPELAIIAAVKSALRAGFVQVSASVEFGHGANVMSTEGTSEFRQALKNDAKVVVVFFDQFEELLYKENLSNVFEEVRSVCAAIEADQSNIVVAFSWKTDGTITTEHGAYHLWHSHADRRFEIDLPPFSDKEVSQAINRFSTELGQPVVPQLRRLLQDHCQGYPWLLKKLCIHILELVKAGADQNDVLSRNLNISNLFKRDLDELSPAEAGCIRQVAQDAPAEVFKIFQNFDEEVVSSLINKRLIIRSGTRLSIYWDIFREYILSGRIPYIPITYIPQSNFSLYRRAASFISQNSSFSYTELEAGLSLSQGATDNLVRDLVNMGYVEANRKDGTIVPLAATEAESFKVAYAFWSSHEIYRLLSAEFGSGRTFVKEDLTEVFNNLTVRSSYSDKTIGVYSMRIVDWLLNVGIISQVGSRLLLREASSPEMTTFDDARISFRSRGYFLAGTSPANVVSALNELDVHEMTGEDAERKFGRKTLSALSTLGLIRLLAGSIVPVIPRNSAEETVKGAALATPTVQVAVNALAGDPTASGLHIGALVESSLQATWSHASKLRYGTALASWARWATGSAPLRPSRSRRGN